MPTHASWLNQVEVWFSILSHQALLNSSFQSVRALVQRIDDYIAAYNRAAHPVAQGRGHKMRRCWRLGSDAETSSGPAKFSARTTSGAEVDQAA